MADRSYTDLELERFLAGDLPAARAAELEAKATAADRARLDELRADTAAFLGSVDVAAEVRAIGKKLGALEPERRGRATWWRWLWAGGALAAAAAVLLVIALRRKGAPDEDIGIKGNDIALVIHTEHGRLASGDAIAPGTKVRFEVATPGKGYIAVIGVDARQGTTVYYPYGGSEAVALDASGLLPGAIQLDASSTERFYAVYSPHPFLMQAVLPELRGGALPAGYATAEVVLQKQLP